MDGCSNGGPSMSSPRDQEKCATTESAAPSVEGMECSSVIDVNRFMNLSLLSPPLPNKEQRQKNNEEFQPESLSALRGNYHEESVYVCSSKYTYIHNQKVFFFSTFYLVYASHLSFLFFL